jgi:phage baseplate assembly protein W
MANAGPKEYSRGLLDFAKNYKFKGSEQEVEDLFDNMERWTSYTVSRAVKNRTALNMKNIAQQLMPDDVRAMRQDESVKKEQNTIDIWENGTKQKYEFKDPLFVYAFQGAQPVSIPILKAMASVANILRKNIVLNPLFSVSQLSQDSIGAMFTSGLKQPFKLPLEVVKEFTKTLRGTSEAAAELSRYGAVGVRDYSAAIARNEVEIASGLKSPTKFQKILAPLEKIAMASDNAVRQAVYNLTLAEGGDKATAVEKAFEIINFKRGGASATVTALRQIVPFYGAYLQAQNVALKTLMGKGISPVQRKEAQSTLLKTTAKVMTLGFIYAALCADDEEYQQMDPSIRDRHLVIPGTGFMLPLRSDVFLLPKLTAEYVYQGITDEGFTDGKKMRRGMKDAVMNAILSPTVVPQAAKPLLEVMTNYSFFTGRPLIGQGLENRVTAEQFTNTTSELAKFLGKAGLVSPITIDHLIRGYTGTTGGMGLVLINSATNVVNDTPRPEKSMQDFLATTPGLSAFVAREYGSGIKNDYYELRKEVDKAVNTYNNMRKTGRAEEAKEFYEEKKDLISVKSQVNAIERQLTKLRNQEKVIYAAPASKMTAEQKGEAIEKIRQTEQRMLKNVGELRARAGF